MSVIKEMYEPTELSIACINYRAKNRLTQRDMAKLCGLSLPTICGIEKGRPTQKRTEAIVKMVIEGGGEK